MKKGYGRLLVLMLSVVIVLSACSSNNNASNVSNTVNTPPATQDTTEEPAVAAEVDTSKDIKGEITVWAFNEVVFEEAAAAFMLEYPNIKVNTVVMPFGDLHDKLQTTLAAGSGAPDVAEVETGQFTRYVLGDVLEDLLQEPYVASELEADLSEYSWNRWKSPDGEKLLGMPWDMAPAVYYYRADIYEELGLPSEPEELGEYIKNPENFLNVVQTLKSNGKYFMEWKDGPIHWAGDEVGYFDGDMNWTRNTEKLVQVLDITKRGNQIGWAPHICACADDGKQMVKNGELVGEILGSWGAREIEKVFPELSGKWRATNLPLDINFGLGGSSFVLPSQSKNKEAAWAYMKWSMTSNNAWDIWTKYSIQPAYKSKTQAPEYAEHVSEYLGGQKDYAFYETLDEKIPVKRITPIDGKGWEVWLEGVLGALDNNTDSRTTIETIAENAKTKIGPDIEKLKAELAQ